MVGVARRVTHKSGYVSFRAKPGYHYVPDVYGRSAHKHLDIRTLPVFGETAAEVIAQGRTLLYYDRLYTIYQALTNAQRNFAGAADNLHAAEVGVYKGGGSYFINSILRSLGVENAYLHCFDTFEGHASADVQTADTFQRPGMFEDTQYESVKQYLQPFPDTRLYKGRFQEQCAQVADHKFCFAHLDVDLYEVTKVALEFFAPRLFAGAAIIVDDYGFATCLGVKQAVDEFMAEPNGFVGFHLLTGQFLLIKHG